MLNYQRVTVLFFVFSRDISIQSLLCNSLRTAESGLFSQGLHRGHCDICGKVQVTLSTERDFTILGLLENKFSQKPKVWNILGPYYQNVRKLLHIGVLCPILGPSSSFIHCWLNTLHDIPSHQLYHIVLI